MPRRDGDLGGGQWLRGAVDLHVAEGEVAEWPELLRTGALGEIPVHIGVLMAHGRGDVSVRVEGVAGDDLDRPPGRARVHVDDRSRGGDRAEVGEVVPVGEALERDGLHGLEHDVRACRDQVRERRPGMRAEHHRRRPRVVVEARAVPTGRFEALVDVFYEIALVVAGSVRDPHRSTRAP